MAVVHKLLVILDHVLMDGTFAEESRYDRHDAKEEVQDKQGALATLEPLGYVVMLSSETYTNGE